MATRFLLLCLEGSLLFTICRGAIKCDCSTEECRAEDRPHCLGAHACYSQFYMGKLERGCIDESSSLLCENRKPSKGHIYDWPSLFCCSDRDFCNRDVVPTFPTAPDAEEESDTPNPDSPVVIGNQPPTPVKCQSGQQDGLDSGTQRTSPRSGGVINPIYIAVPVAGVCVLLALIIFAMYLLRRRNGHYDSYHHYHEHLPTLGHGLKQGGGGVGLAVNGVVSSSGGGGGGGGSGNGSGGGNGGGGGGGGGGCGGISSGGLPYFHHHHHCDCVCKKTLPPCSGKVNRCTDSERSSSGSETKFFLQA